MMRWAMLAMAVLTAAVPKPHANAAHAKTGASQSGGTKIGGWDLKTNQMNANLATGAFTAPVHVTLTRADGSTIQADRASGNYKNKLALLQGHVTVQDTSGTFGLQSAHTASPAQPRGPANLSADRVRVDDATHLYDAQGNVHYQQADTNVDAQTAHLNDLTHELLLTGKVHVVRGDQTLDAQQATYNTQTGDGVAQGNVLATFPGGTPSIATPKPITIGHPKIP